MRRKRIGIGAAVAAGTLAMTGFVLAPSAAAVVPQSATINAECSLLGGGEATLTATQDGTSATITVSSTEITSPIALGEDSIQVSAHPGEGERRHHHVHRHREPRDSRR